MIPNKTRESRRVKALKLPKSIERLYKEGKCRECAVVVTRMNFAKILGKFTKVKIQYESSSKQKSKQNSEITSPISNARLKKNENGMVLIHRNAYNQHPVKELVNSKKSKINELPTPKQSSNILKENNRLKKPVLKDKNSNYGSTKLEVETDFKQYGIIFTDPKTNNNNDFKNKISLSELLPIIDTSILPSEEWCIDYFPKNDEPKEDKVYDRIAAELEDLMYNDKPPLKSDEKVVVLENKTDDFPSIMDILNDSSIENKPNDQSSSDFKTNLESSDVEAMLLGKTDLPDKPLEAPPMDVDTPDVSNLITEIVSNSIDTTKEPVEPDEIGNPQSPSILDEALQKGIEEHLPSVLDKDVEESNVKNEKESIDDSAINKEISIDSDSVDIKNESEIPKLEIKLNPLLKAGITEVVFKKNKDGKCYKSVTCPKNLKYKIELDDKTVEFLGAPKFISSLDDLKVLLQIVNESELNSLYVLH